MGFRRHSKISTISSGRCALGFCAGAAILVGCGALPLSLSKGQDHPQAPIEAPGAVLQSDARSELTPLASRVMNATMVRSVLGPTHTDHLKSWMSPDARNIKKLLYVSDLSTNDVYVYNYQTGKAVGTLAGFDEPYGQCVDKKGDVWITNFESASVVEYAHGGAESIKTLRTDGSSDGCSIDPTTGNLAVSSWSPGEILVFKHASGTPIVYTSQICSNMMPPGYDDDGNLYVQADNSGPYVCELPHGSGSIRGPMALSGFSINFQGSVMWDGRHITLSDQEYNGYETGIYQATEDASGNLTKVGQTALTDDCNGDEADVFQPFIVGTKNTPSNKTLGKVVVGGNLSCTNRFDYWTYPAGGNQVSSLKAAAGELYGQSVSIIR